MRYIQGLAALLLSLASASFSAAQTADPLVPVDTSGDERSEVDGEEASGEVDAGEVDDDLSLSTSIEEALEALGGFDRVTVEASSRLIILRGEVETSATRNAAEEVSRVFASDRYIANAIEVAPAEDDGSDNDDDDDATAADEIDQVVEGRLRRIFATVGELSNVQVESRGGIVALTGSAQASSAMERAVTLAEEQDGVVYVDNDVVVINSLSEQLSATWARLKDKSISLAGRMPMFGIALLVLLLGIFLARRVRRSSFLGNLLSSHAVLQTVLLRVASTAVVIASIVVALDLLEATAVVGAILGTAGVAGIAVAFAFKDIIENYLAGILLAISRPFAPGDAVKLAGHEGKVMGLAARETVLMTYDGNHVQIPNAQVFGDPVLNYSRNPRRRFDFTLGVGNDESLAQVRKMVLQVLDEMDGVMKDPAPLVIIEEFGDSSMTVRIYGWVDQTQNDFLNVRGEAIRQTKRVLGDAGVNLPNPIFQIISMADTVVEHTPEDKESGQDLGVNTEIDRQIAEAPPVETLPET